MRQSGLPDFDGDRPVAEARAVAGEASSGSQPVVDTAGRRYPESDGEVELAVTQVDYTLVGSGRDERPILHVFGRTAANEAEHVRVHGFRPYFYAPTPSLTDEALDRDVITGSEPGYTSIRGEELTRIYARTPRDVGQIRDAFDHYEADILFPNRLLIDKGITSGVCVPARRADDGSIDVPHDELETVDVSADLRVHTMDIEVDDRAGFPDHGEQPIICLTSHDSYRDEYVVWHYLAPDGNGDSPGRLPDHAMLDGNGSVEVRTFDTEEAMLAAYLDYVDETDFDIGCGWNIDDFDAPYLIARLQRLDGRTERDLDYNRLSRVNEVWESDWQGPNVKGRVIFDLLYGYKRTQFSELDSYRLDAVAEEELGIGKERYAGDIGDLWEQDPARLLEYNLRDVELCVEIDRKQEVIAFWREVATFVGCKLEDATTPGDAVDMYVLHKSHGKFALPSKGSRTGEEFEGGAVFDPITGVREMVAVLDLASLYPMAMVTMNASPETKVDDDYDGEVYVAPNGQRFRKEPDGIMREMVDELLTEREQKKDRRDEHEPGSEAFQRYDRQQASVKVIMNCFTPDTEVLTPDGVQNICELEVGDLVYSLNPDTFRLEEQPVAETFKYPDYTGELVEMETSKIDFRVTPNHRMLVRKNERNGITWDDFRFVEAGELDWGNSYELPHGWAGPEGERLDEVDLTELVDDDYEVWVRPSVHGHTFTAKLGWQPRRVPKADVGQTGYVFTPEEFEEHRDYIETVCERSYVHRESGRKWIPRTYDGDDFLRLLAWFVTEGSVNTSEDKWFGEQFRGSATTIGIAQDARRPIPDGGRDDYTAIGKLLERMGFDCYANEKSYQFTSALLGDMLQDLCGEDSFEKRIPAFVFDLDQAQKRLFLDTLIAGDGDVRVNSWRYTTSSTRLRDDVLKLCAHLGLTASYSRDSGSWRIYVTEGAKNVLRMNRSSSRSSADNGVYCVEVADNHTLLAGRNGKFQFVGQSLYGVSGWERFRLYDKESAAAVTATGREVIRFTERAANEISRNVIYGDTDSVMLELIDVLSDETDPSSNDELGTGDELDRAAIERAIEIGFDIEDHINSRYGAFAKEELNAEFHRFELEFEKLYRRFFQAGKKKRYAGHVIWSEDSFVDEIDITGFEYKRSDIAPVTKRVQREVIEKIVRGQSNEAVADYIHAVIEEFLEGDLDLEDIGIPSGIGQRLDEYDTDTAHVRGAKYANLLLGTNFQRGSKPKRLYLEKVHPSFFREFEAANPGIDQHELYLEFKRDPDVICFEFADQMPDAFAVDWETMLEKTLRGPIARVVEALGISWEEVKSGQEQTGLGQYV